MKLLADLPEKYEEYYQDFLEYFTAQEIDEVKTVYGKRWAEILYRDLFTFFGDDK